MLTDTKIRQAKLEEKRRKLYDAKGLFLEIPVKDSKGGSKLWRMKYRFNGKEHTLSFGLYPRVSLREARDKRGEAQKLLAKGTDPKTVFGRNARTS